MIHHGMFVTFLFIGGLVTIFLTPVWRPAWRRMSLYQKIAFVLCAIGLTLIILGPPLSAVRAWSAIGH
jgi:hypothetical protein